MKRHGHNAHLTSILRGPFLKQKLKKEKKTKNRRLLVTQKAGRGQALPFDAFSFELLTDWTTSSPISCLVLETPTPYWRVVSATVFRKSVLFSAKPR